MKTQTIRKGVSLPDAGNLADRQELKKHIRSLLSHHLPVSLVQRIMRDPQLLHFMEGVIRQHGPGQIRTLRVEEQHGNITIHVTLARPHRRCITQPASDGMAEQTECSTTSQLVSQQSLVFNLHKLKRLVNGTSRKYPSPQTLRQDAAAEKTAPQPQRSVLFDRPNPPIFPNKDQEQLRNEAMERARSETAGRVPSWQVIDVNPETHEALIRHTATGSERWVVRDDLFKHASIPQSRWFKFRGTVDNVFSVTIDGVKQNIIKNDFFGILEIELKKGSHRLDIEATDAPDNTVTMMIRLPRGFTFNDGTRFLTRIFPRGKRVTYYFVVQ